MTPTTPRGRAEGRQSGVLTYDAESRTAYVKFSDALVVVTRQVTPFVLLDLDADAQVIGVELIDVLMETDQ